MTSKVFRNLNCAGDAALLGKEKADMVYKHGAVICKKGKPVAWGFNHKRSYCQGVLRCSFHAEMHALRSWKATFLKGKKNWSDDDVKRLARKFDIYVVRLANGSDGYLDSGPCYECTCELMKTGFKNIFHSSSNGGFVKKRITELDSEHFSEAQANLNQFIDIKHRFRI